MQIPRANQVVGLHVDIAAAGGDVRNLHIVDGSAGVKIHQVAIRILLHQSQAYHIVLDSVALRDIGRHHRSI